MIRIKTVLFGLFLRLRSLVKSVITSGNVHIGDRVRYNGELCYVSNGVKAPIWKLYKVNDESEVRQGYEIHQNDFRKVISWKGFRYDLFFLHNWYMGYWYNIHLREMLNK